MKRVFTWILNHQKTVVVLFLVPLIACFFLSQLVSVNYNLMDYLPDGSPSTIALDVMEAEYDGGIPNARLMIAVDSTAQGIIYKEQIESIDGITSVMWLDDVVDVFEPLTVFEKDTIETYYKDGYALYTITIDELKRNDAVLALDGLFGDGAALAGAATDTAFAMMTTDVEISRAMVWIILLLFVVLILTTESYFEPVLFMVTLGVAIMLNNGTNILFGEISFVTNAAGSVLQLAVSMDYSIFLLHRFTEFRGEGMEAKEAMLNAMQKSIGSIFASAFTTIIGFAALIIMKFKIGPDMGIVMAKAIFLSLLSVMVLLPVLALYCYKLIDRTSHRKLMPDFHRLAHIVKKARVPVLILFIALIVPCYLGQNHNSFYYGSSMIFGDDTTKVGRDREAIEAVFGESNTMVLMVPKGHLALEEKMSEALHAIPEVTSIMSYVDTVDAVIPTAYLDKDTLSMLISEHYSRFVLNIKTPEEGALAFAVVENVRAIAEECYPGAYHLAGESVNTYDLKDAVTADMLVVNGLAIAAVFMTLLVTFRSASLPVILVLAIETAVWINLSIPYFLGQKMFYIAYLILSSVQLGATVDYAILYTSRYLEERTAHPKQEAVLRATQATSLSIFTSGIILTLGCLILGKMSTHGIISQLGMLLSRGAVISMMIVIFALPAMLYTFDGFVRITTKNAGFIANKKHKKSRGKKKSFASESAAPNDPQILDRKAT